jgi:hypothetical protein
MSRLIDIGDFVPSAAVPRIFYPFLAYRSEIVPFLVLTAVVVPWWLAWRLYRRRARPQPPSFGREFLFLVFIVYLSGLAVATLRFAGTSRPVADTAVEIELRPSLAALTCSSAAMPERSSERGFCVRNARGNLLLFFPLGILIPLVWRRFRFWRALQIAVAVSFGIELLQLI